MTAFDWCTDGQHLAACGIYEPFVPCAKGSHGHIVDLGGTAFRLIERCPETNEYSRLPEMPCDG